MITLSQPSFWLNFLYFFLTVFLAFYIPGSLLLHKIKITRFQKIVMGIVIGMAVWGLLGFLFGFLHLRFLTYIYLFISIVFWLKLHPLNKFSLPKKFTIDKTDILIFIIITAGVLIQLSSVWFVGLRFDNGQYFCCGNTSDNLYHIALTNQLIKNIPPSEPGMVDVTVHNYHYLGNLVVAELIRVFYLPLIPAQFQYTTVLISVLLGLSILVFGQVLSLRKRYSAWLLFFLYFGSDLIYLLVSFMRREVNFQMSSLEDGTKFLENPPRAISIVVFFISLSLFILWIRRKDVRIGWLMAILFGTLISFKVYSGFFVLSGISMLMLYFLFAKKFALIPPLIMAFIISLLLYLPVNSSAGGFYYTGLSIFENFIVQPWMMLDRLELRREIYASHHNILRVIEYEGIYIALFFITIFGTKLLGLFQNIKSLKLLPKELHIILISGIIGSLFLGLFFQQTSGGANSFNFLVSVFIFGSIYTALTCYYFLPKINFVMRYFLIALIIILTIPRILYSSYQSINSIIRENGFWISNYELNALEYLKHTPPESVIAVDPIDFPMDFKQASYISFLADRQEFIAGTGILSSHGINIKKRVFLINNIFQSKNCNSVKKSISDNKINYLLLTAKSKLNCVQTSGFLKLAYSNSRLKILKSGVMN